MLTRSLSLYAGRGLRETARVSARAGILLRVLLWLLLGGWVGALVLLAFVVAPAAFRVLTSEQAGRLVGEVLPALQLYGAGAGLALAVLARLLGRGPVAGVLPLVLGGLGLVSLFGVTPRLEEIRELAFGPAQDPAARAHFMRLHVVSGGIHAATLLGAVLLAWRHAAAEAPGPAKKNPGIS
jgi:hypothetical protein